MGFLGEHTLYSQITAQEAFSHVYIFDLDLYVVDLAIRLLGAFEFAARPKETRCDLRCILRGTLAAALDIALAPVVCCLLYLVHREGPNIEARSVQAMNVLHVALTAALTLPHHSHLRQEHLASRSG